MRKNDIMAKLNEYSAPYNARWTRHELAQVLRNWVDDNIPLEIERLSQESGHKIF